MQQYQLNNEDELNISYFVQQLIPKYFQEYMVKYAPTPSKPEDGLAIRLQAQQMQCELWFEELNRQLNYLRLEVPKK
jgi:hypothetical protein